MKNQRSDQTEQWLSFVGRHGFPSFADNTNVPKAGDKRFLLIRPWKREFAAQQLLQGPISRGRGGHGMVTKQPSDIDKAREPLVHGIMIDQPFRRQTPSSPTRGAVSKLIDTGGQSCGTD